MFNFLGGSGGYRDPDKVMAEAYGVSPEVIALQRMQSLGNMGTLLTAAAGGADSPTVMKGIVDGGEDHKRLQEMANIRLTGAQIKNQERALAQKELEERRAAVLQDMVMREFFGGSLPGVAGPTGPASIAQAAGIPMAPTAGVVPPTGGSPTVPAGVPIGNTPIDPNNLPVVAGSSDYSNLTPSQATIINSTPMAQRAQAAQSISAQLRAAGVPDAAVRGVGIMMLKDPARGIEKANEYLMRKRVVDTQRTDDGKIIQRDSDGFTTVVDASTLADRERVARMQAGVDVEKHYATAPTITGAPEIVGGKRIYTDQYGQPKVIDAPTEADEEAKLRQAEAGKAREQQNKDGWEGLKSSSETARVANEQINKFNQGRELLKAGVFHAGSNWKSPILNADQQRRFAAMAEAWGIAGWDTMGQAERTAAFQSIARGLAKDMIKGLGTNPTDADLRAAEAMAGGNLNDQTAGQVLKIFEENEKVARRNIASYNKRYGEYTKGMSEADRARLVRNGYDLMTGTLGGTRTDSVGESTVNGKRYRIYQDKAGRPVGYEELF